MKIVVQRSLQASCRVEGKITGSIDHGLVLLVGFTEGDDDSVIDYMVNKVLNLRIFDDENGIMNKSIDKTNDAILSISQFTLYGDAKKGNRPSYERAMKGEKAISLYEKFNAELAKHIKVETGIFGADMKISLINDGPVTIILEKEGYNV